MDMCNFYTIRSSTSLAWCLTASSYSKTIFVVLWIVSPLELIFWDWWIKSVFLNLCVTSTSLLYEYVLPTLEYYFPVRGSVPNCHHGSGSRSPGAFGGKALPWPRFLVFEASSSCCWTVYDVQGWLELESLFVLWAALCYEPSSRRGPSIGVRGDMVKNTPICKMFYACPSSCVERPSYIVSDTI